LSFYKFNKIAHEALEKIGEGKLEYLTRHSLFFYIDSSNKHQKLICLLLEDIVAWSIRYEFLS